MSCRVGVNVTLLLLWLSIFMWVDEFPFRFCTIGKRRGMISIHAHTQRKGQMKIIRAFIRFSKHFSTTNVIRLQ